MLRPQMLLPDALRAKIGRLGFPKSSLLFVEDRQIAQCGCQCERLKPHMLFEQALRFHIELLGFGKLALIFVEGCQICFCYRAKVCQLAERGQSITLLSSQQVL